MLRVYYGTSVCRYERTDPRKDYAIPSKKQIFNMLRQKIHLDYLFKPSILPGEASTKLALSNPIFQGL